MFKHAVQISLVLASILLSACAEDATSTSRRAIIDQPCAGDVDCPSGFECEVEVEHGTTTSFCIAHDEAGTCPAGYELEIEHGQSFCKPHGGDDDGAGSGSGVAGSACTSDADCGAGLECELEVEHGTTTSTCRPHGGA